MKTSWPSAASMKAVTPSTSSTSGSRLRRKPVVLGEVAGPERIKGPVLQQDVDLAAQRRGARCEQRRRAQLVIGPGQQRDRQGALAIVHSPPPSCDPRTRIVGGRLAGQSRRS